MATMIGVLFTFFVATTIATVKLIQVGGWLAILAAILVFVWFFTSSAIIIILLAGEIGRRKQQEKGAEKK